MSGPVPSPPAGGRDAAGDDVTVHHATASVDDRAGESGLDPARWASLAEDALADLRLPAAVEVGLHFVGEDEMAQLNEAHLGHEGPTDVLAFPLDDPRVDPVPPTGGPVIVGDVVICPAVARRNAPDHAGTVDDELALLVVHGLLHLLGMDHAEPAEREVMQARERDLLDRFHPTTERGTRSGAP